MTAKKRKKRRGGARPGAGRPATGKTTTQVCFTAWQDEVEAIDNHVAKHNLKSRSVVVKVAVRDWFGLEY